MEHIRQVKRCDSVSVDFNIWFRFFLKTEWLNSNHDKKFLLWDFKSSESFVRFLDLWIDFTVLSCLVCHVKICIKSSWFITILQNWVRKKQQSQSKSNNLVKRTWTQFTSKEISDEMIWSVTESAGIHQQGVNLFQLKQPTETFCFSFFDFLKTNDWKVILIETKNFRSKNLSWSKFSFLSNQIFENFLTQPMNRNWLFRILIEETFQSNSGLINSIICSEKISVVSFVYLVCLFLLSNRSQKSSKLEIKQMSHQWFKSWSKSRVIVNCTDEKRRTDEFKNIHNLFKQLTESYQNETLWFWCVTFKRLWSNSFLNVKRNCSVKFQNEKTVSQRTGFKVQCFIECQKDIFDIVWYQRQINASCGFVLGDLNVLFEISSDISAMVSDTKNVSKWLCNWMKFRNMNVQMGDTMNANDSQSQISETNWLKIFELNCKYLIQNIRKRNLKFSKLKIFFKPVKITGSIKSKSKMCAKRRKVTQSKITRVVVHTKIKTVSHYLFLLNEKREFFRIMLSWDIKLLTILGSEFGTIFALSLILNFGLLSQFLSHTVLCMIS